MGAIHAIVNPSYLEPQAFDAIASSTADARWRKLHDDSRELVGALTAGRLPPLVSGRAGRQRRADTRTRRYAATVWTRRPAGRGELGDELQRRGSRTRGTGEWPRLRDTDAGRGVIATDLSGTRPLVAPTVRNPLGLVAAASGRGPTAMTQRRRGCSMTARHCRINIRPTQRRARGTRWAAPSSRQKHLSVRPTPPHDRYAKRGGFVLTISPIASSALISTPASSRCARGHSHPVLGS